MEDISLQVLTKKLFETNLALDKWQENSKERIEQIKAKYDPRTEFNFWRNSQEGKQWKQQKYQTQKGCCAICQQSIPLKGSHIDHIKPLSSYPKLALELQNLQITCPDCNISKNNRSALGD